MGPEIIITLLLGLIDRSAQIGALISKARAENRDVTSAEIDALMAADDAAKDALDREIAKAKAEGR